MFSLKFVPSASLVPKNHSRWTMLLFIGPVIYEIMIHSISIAVSVKFMSPVVTLQQHRQESCAIAKMTAQCAIYMGALKIFGTP